MPFYGVARGFRPGVYLDFSDCWQQVSGYSGSQFRKFNTHYEASCFVEDHETDDEVLSVVSSAYSSYGYYSTDESEEEQEEIYVDGACRGNGVSVKPCAGAGIYFGRLDSRNRALPLHVFDDETPTNQRAELHALRYALKHARYSLNSGGLYNIL